MANPKRWMQRSETVLTLGAVAILAIAWVASRLFGS